MLAYLERSREELDRIEYADDRLAQLAEKCKSQERAAREAAGRLACLLAARADCVVQLFCGIPTVLKGELPKC